MIQTAHGQRRQFWSKHITSSRPSSANFLFLLLVFSSSVAFSLFVFLLLNLLLELILFLRYFFLLIPPFFFHFLLLSFFVHFLLILIFFLSFILLFLIIILLFFGPSIYLHLFFSFSYFLLILRLLIFLLWLFLFLVLLRLQLLQLPLSSFYFFSISNLPLWIIVQLLFGSFSSTSTYECFDVILLCLLSWISLWRFFCHDQLASEQTVSGQNIVHSLTSQNFTRANAKHLPTSEPRNNICWRSVCKSLLTRLHCLQWFQETVKQDPWS